MDELIDSESLLPLAEVVQKTGYSQGHINWLCRTGQLSCAKVGRNWITSVGAVHDLMARHQPKLQLNWPTQVGLAVGLGFFVLGMSLVYSPESLSRDSKPFVQVSDIAEQPQFALYSNNSGLYWFESSYGRNYHSNDESIVASASINPVPRRAIAGAETVRLGSVTDPLRDGAVVAVFQVAPTELVQAPAIFPKAGSLPDAATTVLTAIDTSQFALKSDIPSAATGATTTTTTTVGGTTTTTTTTTTAAAAGTTIDKNSKLTIKELTISDLSSGLLHVNASGLLSSSAANLASGDVSGILGVANGGTGTSTALTAGSVVFAGTDGVYNQDASNLFWDDTNNRLGILTKTPAVTLHVGSGTVRFDKDLVVGGATASTENITNPGFVMSGDDLFVAGQGGFAGNVYTNGSFIAGGGTVTLSSTGVTFSGTTPSISVGNGGKLSISDGTNTLISFNDEGSTGGIDCTGCIDTTDISSGAIQADDIADNAVSASDLGGTLTFAAGDLVDLAAIVHNSTSVQGLLLPNAASATPSSPSSGEGYLAWDTSGNQLITYNGSSWSTVGGGSGAPTDASYITIATNSTLSAERTLAGGGGLTLTDAGANGAATLAAGAGTGIIVNADDVAVDTAVVVTLTGSQTLTNKTLTAPTIQGTVGAGTGLTLPAFTAGGNITGQGALTVASGGSLGLTLDSASDTITLAASDTTLTTSLTSLNCTDCIDADDLADAIALDVSTSITQDGAETLTITNSSSGNTIINLTSTGDLVFQDNGAAVLTMADDGGFTYALPAGTVDFTVSGLDADSQVIFSGLNSCDSIDTNASGQLACGTDAGASSTTLQASYDATSGNTITTSTARDIDITLADSATDSNLDIQIATASTSTVSVTRVAGVGSSNPAQLLLLEDLDADLTIADGLLIRTAGVLTDAIDLSDPEITNAINVAANTIAITTGTIGSNAATVVDFSTLDLSSSGDLTSAPTARSSGSPTLVTLTGPAHTTLAASTEAIDVNLNLARTVQFSTGALTTQRAVYVQAPTYAFAGASTLTNAATLAISGAPAAGTNATITNAYALWVDGGLARFDGPIVKTVQTLTIADDGVGLQSPTGTLTPSTSFAEVTCNDPDGCNFTLSETGAKQGQVLTMINVGTNSVILNDTAGVIESSADTLSQYQSASFIYMSDRWVQTARSLN